MRKFFQHIRRQPKSIRDNYALGIAVSFTALVLLVWVIARPEGGMGLDADSTFSEHQQPTAFATLFKKSKEQLASLKNSFGDVEVEDEETNQVNTGQEVNSTTSASTTMILNQEDLDIINQNADQSPTTSTSSTYAEVMIGTTSSPTVPESTASTSASSSVREG